MLYLFIYFCINSVCNGAIIILQSLMRITEQLIGKDSEEAVMAFHCKGYYAV